MMITSHRDCKENQRIPLYMLLDEILNESDVIPVLPFGDIRNNT